MNKMSMAGGLTVAGDLRIALGGLNASIVDIARLSVSTAETVQSSEIPVKDSQRALRGVIKVATLMLDAREEAIKTLDCMLVIKGKSNQAETDFGCTPGMPATEMPMMTSAPQAFA